jgi:hypothetical protein
MSKALPHPTDEGKWMCSDCDYGHGEGNGKSRNAVYKHWNKHHKNVESILIETESNTTVYETTEENTDFVQSDDSSTFEWGSIGWGDPETDEEVVPKTIPSVFAESLNRPNTALSAAGTKQILRMGYIGLDRLITHWGRGVMSNREWKIERHSADYDALQDSTWAVMQHYGVAVNVSPVAAWAATVGTAYVPPLVHIQQNADPNRKGNFVKRIRGFFGRFRLRRKKTTQNSENTEDDTNE